MSRIRVPGYKWWQHIYAVVQRRILSKYCPAAWRDIGLGLLPALIFWGIYLLLPRWGYVYTWTGSLPQGLWRKNVLGVQSHYVEFCLPDGVYSRFYREKILLSDDQGPYMCPNNVPNLIKPIMARSGDQIELTRGSVSVNGVPLARSETQSRSHRKGVPVPHILRGHYTVQPGTVWVFSTYNAASYDSRYYGPIDMRWIQSGVEPVLVYSDNPDYSLVTSGTVYCLWRFCWVARHSN